MSHQVFYPIVTTLTYATSIIPSGNGPSNILNIPAITGNITFSTVAGTPQDGNSLVFRLNYTSGTPVLTFPGGANGFSFGSDVTTGLIPTGSPQNFEMAFKFCTATTGWRAVAIVRGF